MGGVGQDGALIGFILAVERGGAGDRDHTHAHTLRRQLLLGVQGQRNLGAAGQNHRPGLAFDTDLARLRLEAETVASLNHPNVVPVLAFGVAALEGIHDWDIGIGGDIVYGPADHPGSDMVFGWLLQPDGTYKQIELE